MQLTFPRQRLIQSVNDVVIEVARNSFLSILFASIIRIIFYPFLLLLHLPTALINY